MCVSLVRCIRTICMQHKNLIFFYCSNSFKNNFPRDWLFVVKNAVVTHITIEHCAFFLNHISGFVPAGMCTQNNSSILVSLSLHSSLLLLLPLFYWTFHNVLDCIKCCVKQHPCFTQKILLNSKWSFFSIIDISLVCFVKIWETCVQRDTKFFFISFNCQNA